VTSTDRRALILVAHADDETLGCGGTIQKLVRQGWKVDVVIVSDGIVTSRGKKQDNTKHAESACAVLGAGAPRFLGFPDQRFDMIPMADLANAVSSLGMEPNLILTHVDSDLNADHRLVCEAAKIVGRPRSRPVSILGCEIPNTSFWGGRPFPANYYVGITDEIERKIEAFCCYKNELQPYPHPWSREGLQLLAQYHGMQCGYGYAEAFSLIRGCGGLMPDDFSAARSSGKSTTD
jgi:LmbE family N-acetylglucosaminyl deacetylase